MKMPVQEKIAELERRIVALEAQAKRSTFTQTTTQTTTERPLTPDESKHYDAMWTHFSAAFAELGKMFR